MIITSFQAPQSLIFSKLNKARKIEISHNAQYKAPAKIRKNVLMHSVKKSNYLSSSKTTSPCGR